MFESTCSGLLSRNFSFLYDFSQEGKVYIPRKLPLHWLFLNFPFSLWDSVQWSVTSYPGSLSISRSPCYPSSTILLSLPFPKHPLALADPPSHPRWAFPWAFMKNDPSFCVSAGSSAPLPALPLLSRFSSPWGLPWLLSSLSHVLPPLGNLPQPLCPRPFSSLISLLNSLTDFRNYHTTPRNAMQWRADEVQSPLWGAFPSSWVCFLGRKLNPLFYTLYFLDPPVSW